MPILPFGWPPGWGPTGKGPHAFEPTPRRATSDALKTTGNLSATLGALTLSATAVGTTTGTTSQWLGTHDDTIGCFTAVIEGLPYIFTTASEDSPSVNAIFSTTDWASATVHRGLQFLGRRQEKIDLWDGAIRPDRMAVVITDVDNIVSALFLKDASTTAKITTLYADLTPNMTGQALVRNSAAFAAAGTFYCGTEAIDYTSKVDNASPPDSLVTLNRARYAPFKTASSAPFAPTHRLDTATGFAPVVSSEPLSHLNRTVTVRFHHQAAGAWSTAPYAYTVFVGRIKEIQDDGLNISLLCNDYREALVQSVMRQRYEGTLAEGVFLDAAKADITFEAFRTTSGAGDVSIPVQTAQIAGVGAQRTHSEIAGYITAQLTSWANSGVIPSLSFYGATYSMSRSSDAGGPLYKLRVTIDGAISTQVWTIKIGLHPVLWELLGFDTDGMDTDSNGRRIDKHTLDQVDTTHYQIAAPRAPLRATLRDIDNAAGTQFSVQNATGSFTVQPTIPAFVSLSSASGFLKIGENMIVAVSQTATDTFQWQRDDVVSEAFGRLGFISGELTTFFRDDGSADGIPVRQVWLETGQMGDIIVKLLLSTGVTNYNYSGLDVYSQDLGMAIPASIVNIDEWRTHLGNDPYVLLLDGPRPFADILESACAFKSLTPPAWVDGKITVRPLGGDAAAGEADGAFTQDNKAEPDDVTTATRSTDHVINKVQLNYQADLGGAFKRSVTVNQVTSQSDLSQAKGIQIPALGIYEDTLYFPGGAVRSWMSTVAATILAYFSRPLVVLERTFNYTILPKLFVGAKVTITDPSVVDPTTGLRGVTALPCWVLGYEWDWSAMKGRVQLCFVPRNNVQLWAPSAQIDTNYNTAPFTRGYDAAGLRIKVKPHAYSHTSQAHDIHWFAGGYEIHVVQLSATAPTEWFDIIDSIDEANDIISLGGAGLGGYPGTGEFVVEFDDILSDTAAQLAGYEFIADDADNSTGKAENDAYLWGGPAIAVASWLSESTNTAFPHRKIPSAAATKGEPHSVHKWRDLHDFANTALERNTAPNLINEVFPVGEQPFQTGTSPLLAYGPIRIPLFGGPRPLKVIFYCRMTAGIATLRAVTSTGLVYGTSETSFSYPDGGSHAVTTTVASFDPIFSAEVTLTTPALTGGLPPFCYFTSEISCTDGNTVWLLGIAVREAGV